VGAGAQPGATPRPAARRFLDGLRPHVARDIAPKPARKRGPAPEAADAELFGRLRAWRKSQADAQGSPPYIVFSDATLVAIADARPQSAAALARISGVGPMKLERYADPLLAVLAGADPQTVAAVELT